MKRKLILAGWLVFLLRAAFAQTQLLTNGGFESASSTTWVVWGPGAVISTVFPRTGALDLAMGNVDSANQTVSQTLFIPTNFVNVAFNYYLMVISGNTNGIDQLKVWIVGSTNSGTTNLVILATVDQESNSRPQGIYFQKSYDLTPYIGQTIAIYFAMTTSPGSGHLTTMYIDDVSVQAATNADLPPNDYFTNRAVLTGAPVTVHGTNTFATKEPGEPNHGGNTGGRSLWWRWTAPTGGTVTLKTLGSSFNTLLGVYTGLTLSNLTLIASNNGFYENDGTARAKFTVFPGMEYEIAVDGYQGVLGSNVLSLTFAPDIKAPSVSFTSPGSNAKLSNPTFVVQGKASDDIAVALVQYRLENAAFTNDYQTATGTNIWSATISNLVAGLNTVRVRAYDASSNVSATAARSFHFVVPSPLTVTKSGSGSVSPDLNGDLLTVASSYTITAKPGPNFLFSDWSGDATSTVAKLTFIMRSNMQLHATFVTNPFLPVAGTFQGLFFDTNGVAQPSSGFFNATVKSSGSFSAKFLLAGKSYSKSGQFLLDGSWSNSITRSGLSPLSVQLQLDLAGSTLNGLVSDGTWTASLLANRAVFSKSFPAPQAGKYTLLIPGADTSAGAPGGESYGGAKVDSAGNLTFSGVLADGTKVSQKTFVSGQGDWPFYLSLNKGGTLTLGWLVVTNGGTNDLDGLVTWIRLPQSTAKFYPAGFTNQTDAAGSRYNFTNGVPVLNVSTGQVWLANGNLAQNVTNEVVLSANGRITGTTNGVSLTITTSSGLFKGNIPDPATGRNIPVGGVVLQKQNLGGGFFKGTNQVGRVHFGP